ncbi:structural cement protein Gp24 [Xenorhabdus stockiae]|uniref:structural cement protein Gp24 n=1 Tax=Xenorhabdus stockiae TaxID=351614 RepID=UPI003CF7A42D
MAGTAYLTRMPMGIPGAVTRLRDLTTEPALLDTVKVFAHYGLVGKYHGDKFVPLEDGDSVEQVAGILVRPYPVQSQADMAYLGVKSGITGDILKRGYMTVAVKGSAENAKKGGKVYVRVAGEQKDSPLGSFVLTPDATATNTPELPKAQIMGPGDATGTIEIAYNI